jgi:DNA polymerase-1
VTDEPDLTAWLHRAGVRRGDLVGLAVVPDGRAGVSVSGPCPPAAFASAPVGEQATTTTVEQVRAADAAIRPRWVAWPDETYRTLVANGVRLATGWDLAAVHRLLHGGWRADPGYIWAIANKLDPDKTGTPGTLFSDTPDGYLDLAAREDPQAWSGYALQLAREQQKALGPRETATARSESAAELLCAELTADGLPVSRQVAEDMLTEIIGSRNNTRSHRAERDAAVLKHAPEGVSADLRSPQQVKDLLAAAGIDVPDTRAFRLKEIDHPLVRALLEWRKAERIATTYGYSWLDASLGADGRLRGSWTSCDGAAGRMTASAGLHNMPAILRRAVIADEGHVFVRADLGQIEPRVLAAVSGDRAFAAATLSDDLYLPVAKQFGVSRDAAKVAVLGAMYGQTTGTGAQALRRLKQAFPVAMTYLDNADADARAGRALRTFGGRRIPMRSGGTTAQVAARGRYGRNAMIQGAAAEFFKMWAATARARIPAARIVLCLHDELLMHTPDHHGPDTSAALRDCLTEAARHWSPSAEVRFTVDISIIRCWADAKLDGPALLAVAHVPEHPLVAARGDEVADETGAF